MKKTKKMAKETKRFTLNGVVRIKRYIGLVSF